MQQASPRSAPADRGDLHPPRPHDILDLTRSAVASFAARNGSRAGSLEAAVRLIGPGGTGPPDRRGTQVARPAGPEPAVS
ncbi:hypothetical protein [Streptomyces sp. NRRL S-340]|uniref:hypothetical protein n=1 Tax=Streptomyces sp. NRRL S-340 TaxID=1463901 RepID=UPI000B10DCC2|nr:hypothetical protein [Streptomyces sp. NRRL S-340]